MEPDTQVPVPPQKHFMNRVTTLSKVLAAVVFITLPIVTLWLGYQRGAQEVHSTGEQQETLTTSKIQDVQATYESRAYVSGTAADSVEYFQCPGEKDMIAAFSSNVYSGTEAYWVTLVSEGSKIRTIEEFGGALPFPDGSKRYQISAEFIIDFYPDKAVIVLDRDAGIDPDENTGYVICIKI